MGQQLIVISALLTLTDNRGSKKCLHSFVGLQLISPPVLPLCQPRKPANLAVMTACYRVVILLAGRSARIGYRSDLERQVGTQHK